MIADGPGKTQAFQVDGSGHHFGKMSHISRRAENTLDTFASKSEELRNAEWIPGTRRNRANAPHHAILPALSMLLAIVGTI